MHYCLREGFDHKRIKSFICDWNVPNRRNETTNYTQAGAASDLVLGETYAVDRERT